MPTTLAYIAAQLGVSKMTVSRAINDHPAIHPDTRERVLAVARQMNYRPNQHARALSTNRAHLLGLVVPDLMHSYYAEIAKAIVTEARPAGYEVLICNTEEDAASELREVEALLHRTDGLIIASAVASNKPGAYRRLLREGSKLVLIDRRIEGLKCPMVTTDNIEAGRLATEHLIKLGHRRIGHLRGANVSVAHDRLEGYRLALTQNQIAFDEKLVRECGFFESSGYDAMRAWLKAGNYPKAIFAANDPAAIGAMRAAIEAGLDVPRDLAVIGAGAIHYGDQLRVPLTTTNWDKSELGRQAARLLIDLIETKNPKGLEAKRIVVHPRW